MPPRLTRRPNGAKVEGDADVTSAGISCPTSPTQSPRSRSSFPVGGNSTHPSTHNCKSWRMTCDRLRPSVMALICARRFKSCGTILCSRSSRLTTPPPCATHLHSPHSITSRAVCQYPICHFWQPGATNHSCPSSTGARQSCQIVHATSATSKTAITTIAAPSRATPAPGCAPAAGCATLGGRRMGGTCRL